MTEVYSEIPPPPKKKLLAQTWHNEVLNKFYTLKHGFYYCSTSQETKYELQVKNYKVLSPVNL